MVAIVSRATRPPPARNSQARSHANWVKPTSSICLRAGARRRCRAHRAGVGTGAIAALAGGQGRTLSGRAHAALDQILGVAPRSRICRLAGNRAPETSPSEPADCRVVAGRRGDRSGAPVRLADHGAAGARTGTRSLCGARVSARSALRRDQRPAEAGRNPRDPNQ